MRLIMMKNLSNISFKSVYLFPSINNLSEENKPKVHDGIKMINKYFPENDVFLGSDEKGELTIQVQKTNPLVHLLDPDVAQHINLSPKELVSMITAIVAMQEAHKNIWGETTPTFNDRTKNLNSMSCGDVVMHIKNTILEFNEKYKDLSN